MASNIAQISLFSSFRFTQRTFTQEAYYNTLPFDQRVDLTSYFQKVQANDPSMCVQMLSDFEPTLALYDYNDKLVKTFDAIIGPQITNVTFKTYNWVNLDFSDVPTGQTYYLRLSYTDENEDLQKWTTSPLYVEDLHEGTLLFEYTNLYNDKGVIFVNNDNSLLVFGFRVEGNFDEFQPSSDDVDFIDQVHDSDVLNNTPYRLEKLYIGTDQMTGGLPDWAIDKMNLIFSVNKTKIDNQYYNRNSGSKFTPVRPTNQNPKPTFWSIDIIPNINFNLEQYNTEAVNNGDLVVIKQAKIFDNVAADFSVLGLFTVNSNLIRIPIENKGRDIFTMNVGTTDGGAEIGSLTTKVNPLTGVVDLTDCLNITHVFRAPTDVFITGINGTNLKVTLDWNQYDAPVLNPPGANPGVKKGGVMIYEEITPGDFVLDWDVGTGLGKREWVGWCLCGTNGTKNRAGKYSQGWNKDEVGPSTRGTEVGNADNQIDLTQAYLPNVGLPQFTEDINNTPGDIVTPTSNVARARSTSGSGTRLDYEMLKGVDDVIPTAGLTAPMGEGNPLPLAPDSWVDVWVIKLTN